MIALVCTMSAHAQLSDGVSATLQTGENTTIFYGFDAFKDAITAAPSNAVSVITLSPGAFNNPGTISKSVKIYGAGFQADKEKNISETTVTGDLNIKSTEDDIPVIRMEGVYMNGNVIFSGTEIIKGTEFVKCSWNGYYNRVETDNTIIRQCYIRGNINGENKKATGFLVSNCYFNRIDGFAAGSGVSVNHCILTEGYYQHGPYFYYGNIIEPSHAYAIQAGATCYYNVSGNGKMSNGGNNTMFGNFDKEVWKSYKKLFADEQDDLKYLDADLLSSYILNHMDIEVSDYYRWLYSTRNTIGASNRYITIDQDDYIHYTNSLSEKQDKLNKLRHNIQYRYFHNIN